MNTFKQYLIEAGQGAGQLELVKTDVKKAREYAEKDFQKYDRDLDEQIPDFDKNYLFAQKQAGSGKTQRKDMPVIEEKDVKDLQRRLENGHIDIKSPHPKNTKHPFPKGLTQQTGHQWLENGLKRHDGSIKDDIVKVKMEQVTVGSLHPIQKQIYFDKSINPIAENGAVKSKAFMTGKNTTFIMSKDHYIIDGHHRFLASVLLDPTMKVNSLVIDLPIKDLLPLTLSYSDAVGNKRNA